VNDKCGRLFYPNSYGKRYAPNADLEGSFFSASNAIYSQLANEVKSGSERKLQVVNELLGDHNASVEAIYQGRSDFPELINKQYNSASRLENGGQRFLRALTQLAIIGTAMAIGAAPGLVAGLAAGAFTGPVGALSAFSVATAACGTALGLYFGKQFAEWATNTFPFRHSMEDQIKDFEQRAEMYVHQTPRP
jgi:hypothetical protein